MMDLNERNQQLEQKLSVSDLPEAVTILIKDAKRRKRQIKLLVVSILLDIFLTVGLGVVSINTHNIATEAESNRQAIVQNCLTSNEARANNKQLWDYLLALPTPNASTLQQKQVRDQFTAFVNKTFAARDCSKVVSS